MLYKFIEKTYKNLLYTRADDNGAVFYYSHKDFPGLNAKPFSFKSCDGHNLQGSFYSYDGYISDRIIFFEHGMGSGHTGYIKEIELLAKNGFLVFSYDHTGCMKSGGETTGGFVQSLKDLNDAINAVTALDEYKNADISVIGHSWGGFSSLNICALQPIVKRIVAISGFVSVRDALKQFFAGPLAYFGNKIYEAETQRNPDFIGYNAVNSLNYSDVKALIIHSRDDKTVSCAKHFDLMQEKLSSKENIAFIKVDGKNHNPNYTADAVKYKDKFFAIYKKALKSGELSTTEAKEAFKSRFDWDRMTRQDLELWKTIIDFLKN